MSFRYSRGSLSGETKISINTSKDDHLLLFAAERADGNTAPSTHQPPPYVSSEYVTSPNSPSRSARNSSPTVIVNRNICQPLPPPPQTTTAPLDNCHCLPPPQTPTAPLDNSKRPPPPQKPVASRPPPPQRPTASRPPLSVPISQPPIKPPKPSPPVKSPPTAPPKPQTAPKPSKIQVQWPLGSPSDPPENAKPLPPSKKPIAPPRK